MAFEPRRTAMPRKRHKPEEIVSKLRQVDVLVSQGRSVADAVRSIGVTEVTYYRWRQEFGGLKSDQVKRLKSLETENQGCAKRLRISRSTSSSFRRLPGETTEPRAPPRLRRAHQADPEGLRAPGVPGARSASLDATQGAAGP